MNIKNFLAGALIATVMTFLFVVLPLQRELLATITQLNAVQTVLTEEKNKPPKVTTEVITKTELAYIPKETVVYKDITTGEIITTAEATDIELKTGSPSVYFKYNNENFALPGIENEKYKFDEGKFVGQISTSATIDVTQLVDREVTMRISRQKKHGSVGFYGTNKGIAASAGYINKNWEYKIIVTVPYTSKFYGIGIERKF